MGAVSRSLVAVLAVASVLVAPALASAPPVGKLPPGPTKTLTVRAKQSFWVALPKSTVAGRVWRLARPYDSRIVREVREGGGGTSVWIVYKSLRPGTTRIVYALTLGERSHAYAARRFVVHVH
jgi:predicted secreted protein